MREEPYDKAICFSPLKSRNSCADALYYPEEKWTFIRRQTTVRGINAIYYFLVLRSESKWIRSLVSAGLANDEKSMKLLITKRFDSRRLTFPFYFFFLYFSNFFLLSFFSIPISSIPGHRSAALILSRISIKVAIPPWCIVFSTLPQIQKYRTREIKKLSLAARKQKGGPSAIYRFT